MVAIPKRKQRQMTLEEATESHKRIEAAIKRLAEMKMPRSYVVPKQERMYRADVMEEGKPVTIVATIRHDDCCGNGHNSFAITGERYESYRIPGEARIVHKGTKKLLWLSSCGHDQIVKYLPELAPYIKWHLCDTKSPLHYVANARYWAGFTEFRGTGPNDPPNAAHLRSTIIYGALPDDEKVTPENMEEADLVEWLVDRVPALMEAFQRAVKEFFVHY